MFRHLFSGGLLYCAVLSTQLPRFRGGLPLQGHRSHWISHVNQESKKIAIKGLPALGAILLRNRLIILAKYPQTLK